jgi:molybdate transport system substrate-binding protein
MGWKYNFVVSLTFVFSLGISVFGTGPPKDREILISAAISLKDAFEEIGSIYEKQTGIRVRLNLGASGLLQKQIEAGAPADIFASAGERQMDRLEALGMILSETRQNLVGNSLVLVVPARLRLPLQSFKELVRPEIRRLAIGNPKTVPAGQYASQTLRNLNLWNALESRLVLAENARQVLNYVEREEVEAGILYASDVAIARGKVVAVATAPEDSHSPILYPIAAVKTTENRIKAEHFIDLALSRKGQEVLEKYGFISSQ